MHKYIHRNNNIQYQILTGIAVLKLHCARGCLCAKLWKVLVARGMITLPGQQSQRVKSLYIIHIDSETLGEFLWLAVCLLFFLLIPFYREDPAKLALEFIWLLACSLPHGAAPLSSRLFSSGHDICAPSSNHAHLIILHNN